MRARNIKPGFFKNEDLAALPFETRILYQGLWCIADREGRLEDRPKRIKAEVFPYDDLDCEKLIHALAKASFIVRYTHEETGAKYIQILNFTKHQKPHQNEADSIIPAPLEGDLLPRHKALATKETSTSLLISDSLIPDCGFSEVCAEPEKAPASTPPTERVYLTFPVKGKTHTWDLTSTTLNSLNKAFRDVDLLAECRKALVWLEANPAKIKTGPGMKRFLYGWVERSVNSGKAVPRNGRKPATAHVEKRMEADMRHQEALAAEAEQERRARAAAARQPGQPTGIGDLLQYAAKIER